MPLGSELVHFGADFVMCHREPSDEEIVEMERQWVEARANRNPNELPFWREEQGLIWQEKQMSAQGFKDRLGFSPPRMATIHTQSWLHRTPISQKNPAIASQSAVGRRTVAGARASYSKWFRRGSAQRNRGGLLGHLGKGSLVGPPVVVEVVRPVPQPRLPSER
ncbi:hypothetical protein F4Y93_11820 [Candidatus Poribacteria bacterium]|nr:hypothetical protein [Candidatus Poribacteria bacterium]